jgi:hypothetical protein
MDYDAEWLKRRDDAADREYLMGGGRWHDDGSFIAHRPRMICWRYLSASRRRGLTAPGAGRRSAGTDPRR